MGRKRNSSYPVDAEFSRRPGLYKKIVRSGGLDPELVYGNEMESLPKKSCAPRSSGRDDRSDEKVMKREGQSSAVTFCTFLTYYGRDFYPCILPDSLEYFGMSLAAVFDL